MSLPVPLSDEEKVRIRSHMGYPNVRAVAGFSLGIPATIETAFIIELAMNEVAVSALPTLRSILNVLDAIDSQDVGDLDAHVASRVGEIDINPNEHKLLDSRYDRWLGRLENLLGVARNPFDKRWSGGGAGGINARVG